MKEQQVLQMLAALGHKTRLHIVRFLIKRGAEGAAAGEIAKAAGAAASRASVHLSALEQAGVVSSERQSRRIIYRADIDNLGGLVSFLLNDCCDGHPDILACCTSQDRCS